MIKYNNIKYSNIKGEGNNGSRRIKWGEEWEGIWGAITNTKNLLKSQRETY